MHRLAELLDAAARGQFPPADGVVEVVGPPPGRCEAVVAFTAHSVVAATVPEGEVRARLDPADLGAAMSAPFLAWLAQRLRASPGMVDAVLVAPDDRPADPGPLRRVETSANPRVARALRYREDVQAYETDGGSS